MRRFIAALAALLCMATAYASPAQGATIGQARADWADVAATQLDAINAKVAAGELGAVPAITLAYRAEITATLNGGDYTTPTVRGYITDVLDLKVESNTYGDSGYVALEGQRDAMGDGTLNPADTVYTVTMADHIGPLFLAAAKDDPATYGPEVRFLVRSIMAEPVMHTPHGGCMAYDDSPNDAGICVINASVGAAAFLQRALDEGYDEGQAPLIEALKPLADNTYGIATPHWWPYAFAVTDTARWAAGEYTRPAQDWNHEAYTAESAAYLGTASGAEALDWHLHHPIYNPQSRLPDTRRRARDIMGRLRLEYLEPGYNPLNSLTDAQWFWHTWGDDPDFTASENAQLGLWEARLSEDAAAASIRNYSVGSLARARFDQGATAPAGSRVVIRSFVYNHHDTPIVDRRLELRYAGARDDLVAVKDSGLRGNIAFTATMPSHTICYRFVSNNGTSSDRACISPS